MCRVLVPYCSDTHVVVYRRVECMSRSSRHVEELDLPEGVESAVQYTALFWI